jgi:hypothetical protein
MSLTSYSLKLVQLPFRKFHLGFGIEGIIGTCKPMLRITGLCWQRGNAGKTVLIVPSGLCSESLVTKYRSGLYPLFQRPEWKVPISLASNTR